MHAAESVKRKKQQQKQQQQRLKRYEEPTGMSPTDNVNKYQPSLIDPRDKIVL